MARLPDITTWRKDVHHFSPGLDAQTPRDWRCPCCDRTKFETVQWFERSPSGDFPAGFRLMLARHHDHAVSEDRIEDGRFDVVIICHDCNAVDGKLKAARPELPRTGWSFAPADIRRVITARPHRPHWINYDKARIIALRIVFQQRHPPRPVSVATLG